MNFKQFWNNSFAGFILKRLILALTIFVALAWFTLFFVDRYTNHGQFEVVPDLRGMYIEEAELVLANHGLHTQIIDSVYIRTKKLGTIIEQTPVPQSTVKKNRPIYIIVNSKQVRQIPMPDVTDVSFRQADAMLKAIGINVSGVEYKPSEYKDLVIDVKYRGRSLEAGTRIPENSYITLVVGSGNGGETVTTPNLKGLTAEDAHNEAIASSVIIGSVQYDTEPAGNENEYFVYRQKPAAGNNAEAGTRVDIWLSKDKSLQNKRYEEEENTEDEKFF
ncbi:MAG: PASTA domain-containing protein [Paludibacteraceae bacterium]|nr:PASTA domain-containing protein [Paludibacteraceae bacterium]